MPRLRRREPRRGRRAHGRRARDAAAAGSRREGQEPGEAEVDRGLDAEERPLRPLRRKSSSTGDDVDLGRLPIQTCWPEDAAPFITLPAVITRDPRDGHAQRRHVPHAGARAARDGDALADPQGRADGLPRDRRPARGGGRARARSRDRVRRLRAAPEARRRVHARRLPQGRAGRARPLQDGRPRSPRQRRDRARGLRRAGRPRRRRGRSATTPATTPASSRSRSSTSRR